MTGFSLPLGVARVFAAALATLFAAAISSPARGQSIEPLLQYQGVLRDANTGELVNGETEVTFALFDSEDAPTDTGRLWEEGHLVDVSNGLVSIVLGALDPLPPEAFLEDELWLGVFVGADELEPRQQLLPVAFALRSNFADHAETASDAERLEGHEASDFLRSSGQQSITHHGQLAPLTLTQTGVGPALEAEGVVRAESFEYSEPREREMRVLGAMFHSFADTTVRRVTVDSSVYIESSPTSGVQNNRLVAPLDLPIGARITQMRVQFTDNAPNDYLEVRLAFALDSNPGPSLFSAFVVTSEGVEGTEWVSFTPLDPLVVPDDHAYFLRAIADSNWGAAGSDLRIRSVVLTYEIDEVH